MKTRILPIFSLILLFNLAACTDSTPEQNLRISGSNTIGEHLMPQLVKAFFEQEEMHIQLLQTNFVKATRNDTLFTIALHAEGSNAGLADLKKDMTDLAMISESQLVSQWQGANLRLATDTIVVIAHRYNPIEKLTATQLQAVFAGNLKKWEELTPQYVGTINVHVRDTNSGTFSTFQNLVLNNGTYSPTAKHHASNAELFADIQRDYYGIGYISLSERLSTDDFKILPIEGQTLARPLFLLFDDSKTNDLSRRFRQFCRSQTAREIIEGLRFGF